MAEDQKPEEQAAPAQEPAGGAAAPAQEPASEAEKPAEEVQAGS